MNLIQVLLRVPEGLKVEEIPEEVQERIKEIKGWWAGDPVFNTRPYEGYKLIVFSGYSTPDRLGAVFAEYKLDWKALAINDGKSIQIMGYSFDEVIKYICPINRFNEEGVLEETKPATSIVMGGGINALPFISDTQLEELKAKELEEDGN